MFRAPFNNYQNTGWGFPGRWEYITGYGELYPQIPWWFIESADVVEANFFTGYFLPPEVAAGGEEGFTWGTPEAPIPRLYAPFTGRVTDGNVGTVTYGFSFAGGMFPHVGTSGSLYAGLSGLLPGNVFDYFSLYYGATGMMSGNAKDDKSLYARYSGTVPGWLIDSGQLYGSFASGFVHNTSGSEASAYCGFSGKITSPYSTTSEGFYFAFDAIAYEDGGAGVSGKTISGFGGPVSIHLTRISYTNI